MVQINKNLAIFSLALTVSFLVGSCASKGPSSKGAGVERSTSQPIADGLVTARGGVDVTADDGSLMAEQLQLGDRVFIVTNPAGGERAGWVRISRSRDDAQGYGWIQSNYVRTIPNMNKVSGGAGTTTSTGSSTGGFIEAETGDSGFIEAPTGESGFVEESPFDTSGSAEPTGGTETLLDDLNTPTEEPGNFDSGFDDFGDGGSDGGEEINFDDIFE